MVDHELLGVVAGQVSPAAHALKASPEVEEFVSQITGSAREELGGWLGDVVRLRRFKWTMRACERARKDLSDRGRTPQKVRLNVLLPLLAAAGLEEDQSMSERWAYLLANAADPEAPDVPPSFPEVLRQLSPLDARVLDFVARYQVNSKHEDLNPSPATDAHEDRFKPLTVAWIRSTAAPDVETRDLFLSLDNLARLRLVEFVGEIVVGLNRQVSVTVFGQAFFRACNPVTVAGSNPT